MKYKYLLAALLLGCTLMTGCEKEEPIPEGAILLNAEGFNSGDKTLVDNTNVMWKNGDEVKLFYDGGNASGVTKTVTVNNSGNAYINDGSALDGPVYGYYGCTVTENDNTPTITIPNEYTLTATDHDTTLALPMVAYNSSDGSVQQLYFYHLTAAVLVKVNNTLSSTITIDSVTAYCSAYKLSGTINPTLASQNPPTVGTTDGSGKVKVNVSGLTIANGSIRDIQVPILPVGNNGTLIVEVYAHSTSDATQKYNYSKTVSLSGSGVSDGDGLARNQMIVAGCIFGSGSNYLNINATPLTFEAKTANCTVSLAKYGSAPDVSIEYSTDGGNNWTGYSVGTTDPITLTNVGDKVQFRASGTNSTMASDYYYNHFTLTGTGSCYVYGNVMSLLNNSFSGIVDLSSYDNNTFAYLFLNCSTLYSHPTKELVLPATTLKAYCYYHMFQRCTNLTTAPALPAETLANSCYNSMFINCTGLTTAPALPANTLAEGCYSDMFYGCSSLTTAPALPAPTLASNCYYEMFYGCSSLQAAPELRATELAEECYSGMFKNCTQLTTAPDLPATTLVSRCYQNMFYGCTHLNYIKCLATGFDGMMGAMTYLSDWVEGVANSGTFVKKTGMNGWQPADDMNMYSGIPEGWDVQTASE